MQMRVTLRAQGGALCDVELHAPPGTTVGEVAGLLHRAAAGTDGPAARGVGQSRASSSPGGPAASGLWIGSRVLPGQADLHRAGLRTGCVVGVGEPGPRERDPHPAVRLHVVNGPDAGRVEPITRGQLRIGRDCGCHVRLSDPDVSRQHAELTVTPSGITVRDLGSSNGTVIRSPGTGPAAVDGAGRELPMGSYLTLGETTVCVAGVATEPAITANGADGRIRVSRAPRLDAAPPKRLDLPPDPAPERRAATPWIAALVPALGGVGLAWFLHSPQFLAFALLSPLILLATALGDHLGGRGLRRRTRTAAHRRRVAAGAAMSALADDEAAFRRRAHPDPASLLVTATTPDARLWERRRADPDFLEVRVGLGDAPARAVIRVGTDVIAPVVLPGVPAVVPLADGPLGICGPRQLTLSLARWVVGQLVILHSPADLRLTVLLDDDTDGAWEWLRWLPHARTPSGELRVARTPLARQQIVSQLSTRMDAGPDTPPGTPADPRPWTVLLVDRYSCVPEIDVLTDDPLRTAAARIACVYLDADARRLPPACATIAQLGGETGSRVRIRAPGRRADHPASPAPDARASPPAPRPAAGGRTAVRDALDPVADRVSEHWCDQVSRALAPLSDPGADQANELPVSVRARDLFDLPDLTANTIRARWARANGRAATPVGIGRDGLVEIDLGHDGPHALVAGTTGAGKSELLQTLVAGLALHSPPAELQFVLIDYKGGAAFGHCARLPHTVGMVTDLDAQLTERALRSLDAELHRRETVFARAGAVDLGTYRSSPQAAESVGRLVLVVDEFASLAEELPDFVSGLVGIAQRGRSLGVHLILATQRPGGVVSPEIRANTALRIALRVTDQHDSSDVIGSDLAAQIDRHLPGRAVVRAGQALFPVQIARISTPAATEHCEVEVIPLDQWGSPLTTPAAPPDTRRTDLANVVDGARAAWEVDPVRPRRPWLDPLPACLDLATIDPASPKSDDIRGQNCSSDVPTRVVLGLMDRPGQQDQVAFTLDLHEPSTMLVAGGPRSGRTSLLRMAAVNAAGQLRVEQLHVYVIDGSGGAWQALSALPHCGAVVGRDAPASIAALIGHLSREIDRRHHASGAGEDNVSRGEPALLLLLDGWEGFLAAVEDLDAGRTVDSFLRLLRDGAAAGLSVIVTGDRGALSARLASAVRRRLVLRLADPADYALAGLSRRQLPASLPPGRAIDTADGNEIQLAIFGPDPSAQSQNHAMGQLVAAAADRERRRPSARAPFPVRALPARVHLDDLAGHGGPGRVVLGLGGDSGEPLSIRVGSTRADGPGLRLLVAGPPRSGRSTVLRTIAIQLARAHHVVVAAGGQRSPFLATARDLRIPTLTAEAPPEVGRRDLEDRLVDGRPVTLLIDDAELFADTAIGECLTALIRGAPPGLDVVAAGRTDDVALAFRGIAAEVKRARTGLLLQPGPGDGDLLGLRLPYHRSVDPPGRGLLVAPDLMPAWAEPGPVPVQVALP